MTTNNEDKRKEGESKQTCIKRKIKINSKKLPFKQAVAVSLSQCDAVADEVYVVKFEYRTDTEELDMKLYLDADATFKNIILKDKKSD